MIPTKVYILRTNHPKSIEYAKSAADSCDRIKMPWEYFEGIQFERGDKNKKNDNNVTNGRNFIKLNNLNIKNQNFSSGGIFATLGHYGIWQKIQDNKECAIVLEHDSLLLHKVTIDIPDMNLVALGYKVKDPEKYDHKAAGPPGRLQARKKHGGAHAYALTWTTAKHFLDLIRDKNKISYIDNQYFLGHGMRGKAELMICDPVAAIGWLRESTIWGKSAVDNYRPILGSFKEHYKSDINTMGLKG